MKNDCHFSIIQPITLLFTILLLTASCSQLPGAIPIKMERHRTLLPVRVGNSGPLRIVLDSGMPFDGLLIYNPDLKDVIDLPGAQEVLVPGAGAGEPSRALMADSASFFLGGVELTNQRIIILQSDLYKGFPSDGILGYSILGHYAVEIDYDRNLMTLHDPENLKTDDSWQILPLTFKNNQIPWVDVSVSIGDEEPVIISVYIDFASGDAVELLEKPGMKFTLPDNMDEVHLGRGLSGDIYGKKGWISKLIIGSYTFDHVHAAFTSGKIRSKQSDADGILGNNALRRFNLIFDYAHEKLHIKPNGFFEEPF